MNIVIIICGIVIMALIIFILYLSNKVEKTNGLAKYWHSEYTKEVPQLRADKSVLDVDNTILKGLNTDLEKELSKLRRSNAPLEIEEINGDQKIYVYGNELPFVLSVREGEDIRVDNGWCPSDWDKNIIIELQIPGKYIKSDESLKCIEVVTE